MDMRVAIAHLEEVCKFSRLGSDSREAWRTVRAAAQSAANSPAEYSPPNSAMEEIAWVNEAFGFQANECHPDYEALILKRKDAVVARLRQ